MAVASMQAMPGGMEAARRQVLSQAEKDRLVTRQEETKDHFSFVLNDPEYDVVEVVLMRPAQDSNQRALRCSGRIEDSGGSNVFYNYVDGAAYLHEICKSLEPE